MKIICAQIEREGVGEIPDYDASDDQYLVEYYYAAYTESSDMPFDIVIRGMQKPKCTRIGNRSIIPGLEIALKSMKCSEKASFLIHPHLAYRDGQPPRIPKRVYIVQYLSIKLSTGPRN